MVQDGRVVGVAFQGYPGFDNMGFFIPVPVVRHFLADLERPGATTASRTRASPTLPLLSPAYRRERGLPEGKSGVVVELVAPGSTADGVLQKGDVLLLGGRAAGGERRHGEGGRRSRDLRARLRHEAGGRAAAAHRLAGRQGESRSPPPRGVSTASTTCATATGSPRATWCTPGLVFMPLDRELLKTFGRGWAGTADRNLIWHHLYREAEEPETADREVVVLTRVMRHPVNSQMTFPGPVAVASINGAGARAAWPTCCPPSRQDDGRFHRPRVRRRFGIRGPRPREGRRRPRRDPEAVWDRQRQEPLAAAPLSPSGASCSLAACLCAAPRASRVRAARREPPRAASSPSASPARTGTGRRPGPSRAPGRARSPASWSAAPRILVATSSIGNHLLIEVQKQGEDLRTPARARAVRPRGPAGPSRGRRSRLLEGPRAAADRRERVPVDGEIDRASLAALGPVRDRPGPPLRQVAGRTPRPVAHEPADPRGLLEPGRRRRFRGAGRRRAPWSASPPRSRARRSERARRPGAAPVPGRRREPDLPGLRPRGHRLAGPHEPRPARVPRPQRGRDAACA